MAFSQKGFSSGHWFASCSKWGGSFPNSLDTVEMVAESAWTKSVAAAKGFMIVIACSMLSQSLVGKATTAFIDVVNCT